MAKITFFNILGPDLKPGMDTEENRWNHYNEFVFIRQQWSLLPQQPWSHYWYPLFSTQQQGMGQNQQSNLLLTKQIHIDYWEHNIYLQQGVVLILALYYYIMLMEKSQKYPISIISTPFTFIKSAYCRVIKTFRLKAKIILKRLCLSPFSKMLSFWWCENHG